MPPWLSHLIYHQKKENESYLSKLIQLSTVSKDNTPRVRTVVFRGWTDTFGMRISTDKRSSKVTELIDNNNVEVCWFLPNSRCQFRFRGKSTIDCFKEATRHWELLDEEAKSMWSWPQPGSRYKAKNSLHLFPKQKKDPMDNFMLLKINIYYVEQLIIEKPIHFRRRWIKEGEWIEERLNP